MPLFGSSVATPSFLPDADARAFVLDGFTELAPRLGGPARMPHLLGDPSALLGRGARGPNDLDSLFDMVCAIQEVIGQREVELTLLEIDERRPAPLPEKGLVHLGDPGGKLLHPLRDSSASGHEYLVLYTPAAFRVRELMLAGIARALGHIALDRAGVAPDPEALDQWDADAELAAVLLGMGVWVANGSYKFENACCGGGCGIDLRSIRSGLSMPEACFALAVDGQRKGLRRRAVGKQLEPTQRAALEQSWKLASEVPASLALTGGAEPRALAR
ncbi:hypothetical protein ACNOYE_11410 [Nannocystaceae bacterium ST9]